MFLGDLDETDEATSQSFHLLLHISQGLKSFMTDLSSYSLTSSHRSFIVFVTDKET